MKLIYVFDGEYDLVNELAYDKEQEVFVYNYEICDHRLWILLHEDEIKELADDMGIRYAHNISAEKLSQRIKEFVNEHFDEF